MPQLKNPTGVITVKLKIQESASFAKTNYHALSVRDDFSLQQPEPAKPKPILLSGPVTNERIELGRKLAEKYGLAE